MKKILILALTFTLSLSFGYAQITRVLDAAQELNVTDKLQVTLVPSDSNKVIITGDLASQVEVIQKDNVLRLKMAAGYLLKGGDVFVKVYATDLKSFVVQKGAVIQTEGLFVTADSINIIANEGGKADLHVKADHLKYNGTTGASVALNGSVEVQEINLTFGASLDAKDFVSKQAFVTINGGGKAEVHATVSADVKTRAGGTVNVYGNPSERKQKRLAGGSITFVN